MKWRVGWLGMCLTMSCGLIGRGMFASAEDEKADKPAAKKDGAGKTEKPQEAQKNEPKPVDEAQPQPAANPLQNLFQKLLRPAETPAPAPAAPRIGRPIAKPLGPNEKALDPNARDHIDARAPKDRKQADLLKKGSAAIDNQDWPAALELLQIVLGQEEDSVDRFGKEGWLSLRERALRLILKLPDEVVRTFRQRWSVEAQRRLEEAEQSGRADQI